MRALRIALLLALLLLPAALGAQSLRVDSDLEHPSVRLLRALAARGDYLLITRDTVLPATFHATGDVVVLGAEVRLAGAVDGTVALLQGELFVRPRARVAGPIVSVGGAVYGSGLATMGEVVEVPSRAGSGVEQRGGEVVVVVRAPPPPPRLGFPGALGFGLPTYDRVDGATLRWAAAARLSGDTLGAVARGAVSYHSARGALGGVAALEHPLGREVWAGIEAARATRTNEAWARGSLVNSVAALGLGSDARNYYLSDELSLFVERRPRMPLIAGEGRLVPRLVVRASRDRSLAASAPWSIFGDGWRENPPVDPGVLASVVGGMGAEWKGAALAFRGDAAVEWAPPGAGDFSFAQAVGTGEWSMLALRGHRIDLFAHTRWTLGPDPAPAQRWSFVGGSAGLPTLETGSLRGDRLFLVQSSYSIPLRAPSLPLLGRPALRLEHVTGSAWATGEEPPRWEQSLGAGVDFGLLRVLVFIAPAEGVARPVLNVSAGLPF